MKIYITKFAKYQPSPENPAEQPKLEYVDSLFRRRLSQVTRMTIEAVHGLIGENAGNLDLKLVFASFRGEIARQLKINKGLVEDADVMPASFSISVFNTPAAATTIALGMKAGYTAIYPSEDNFSSALLAAVTPILCGSVTSIIFAYADEKIPEEYKGLPGYNEDSPLVFACLLSCEKSDSAVELPLDSESLAALCKSPAFFLNSFLDRPTDE